MCAHGLHKFTRKKKRVAKVLQLLKSINNTCSLTAFGQDTQMMCVCFNISRDLLQIFFFSLVLPWRQEISKNKQKVSDFQCLHGPVLMEHRPIPVP